MGRGRVGRYQDAYLQAVDIAGDLPISQLVAVLLSCAIGTAAGAWLAASLARRAPKLHGLVVGALLLAAGLIMMFMVPYLRWYWVPGGAILLPAGMPAEGLEPAASVQRAEARSYGQTVSIVRQMIDAMTDVAPNFNFVLSVSTQSGYKRVKSPWRAGEKFA